MRLEQHSDLPEVRVDIAASIGFVQFDVARGKDEILVNITPEAAIQLGWALIAAGKKAQAQ